MFTALSLALAVTTAWAQSESNPVLTLGLRRSSDAQGATTLQVPLHELRRKLKERTFTVAAHPGYDNKTITYVGFYFADVLAYAAKRLHAGSPLQYQYSLWASDNFSAFVTAQDMKAGVAFLAFREVKPNPATADGLWTPVEKHGSPGPFYLVWSNPAQTFWQKWPFKIVNLTLVAQDLLNKFDAVAPTDEAGLKGFRLVLKNCTTCHRVAGVGFGAMGPDLATMAKAVGADRFLQQIRKPVGRMVAFTPSELSDDDVQAVHAYLTHIPAGH